MATRGEASRLCTAGRAKNPEPAGAKIKAGHPALAAILKRLTGPIASWQSDNEAPGPARPKQMDGPLRDGARHQVKLIRVPLVNDRGNLQTCLAAKQSGFGTPFEEAKDIKIKRKRFRGGSIALPA